MNNGIRRTLYLFRLGVPVTKNGATAERGHLVTGGVRYHTIERRGGYVKLPAGTFELRMELSPTKTFNRRPRKQFRIYGHGVVNNAGNNAALLIHIGNFPDHVTGCIAPGKIAVNNGVKQSLKAMNEIFNFCGGFAIGKKVNLHVADALGPEDPIIQLQKDGIL